MKTFLLVQVGPIFMGKLAVSFRKCKGKSKKIPEKLNDSPPLVPIILGNPGKFNLFGWKNIEKQRESQVILGLLHPGKSNMEPENHLFDKGNHLPNLHFWVSVFIFSGVNNQGTRKFSSGMSMSQKVKFNLIVWDDGCETTGAR